MHVKESNTAKVSEYSRMDGLGGVCFKKEIYATIVSESESDKS